MRWLLPLILTLVAVVPSAAPATPFGGGTLLSCPAATPQSAPPPNNPFKVDPIVSFGVAQSDHVHWFCGSDQASSTTTYPQLVAGGTTVDIKSDKSLYWVPNIIRPDGTTVPASEISMSIYYRAAGLRRTPFPAGLRFVWGNPHNLDYRKSVAVWKCGATGAGSPVIPTSCASRIGEYIYVGSCWDGKNLGAGGGGADNVTGGQPISAYDPATSKCPADHPIPVPELQYQISFPSSAAGGRLTSDDPAYPSGISAHVDFFNGWTFNSSNHDAISLLTDECLNQDSSDFCDVIDGKLVRRSDGKVITD